VSRTVGSPTTWPASWAFAVRHHVTPDRYDRLSGRYLFYRQNNLGGRIDLGEAGDDAMLDGGWGDPARDGSLSTRPLRGRGRLFAPLDVPETLTLRVHARAPLAKTTLSVRVNGIEAGRLDIGPEWQGHELKVPVEHWCRETNEVVLDVPQSEGPVAVDRIDFVRERP
jgi:hypothetical protein